MGISQASCQFQDMWMFHPIWWCQLTPMFHSAVQTVQSTKQFQVEWTSRFIGAAIFVWPIFLIFDVAIIQELLLYIVVCFIHNYTTYFGYTESVWSTRHETSTWEDCLYHRFRHLRPSISRGFTVLVLTARLRLCWSTSSRDSTLAVLEKGQPVIQTVYRPGINRGNQKILRKWPEVDQWMSENGRAKFSDQVKKNWRHFLPFRKLTLLAIWKIVHL